MPNECPYCNLVTCPILNKDQCLIKALWERVEEMKKITEEETGLHIVNLGQISQN